MGLAELAKAVAAMPPPPCDGCSHWDQCARLKLACEQFYVYTDKDMGKDLLSPTREPSRLLYDITFNGTGKIISHLRQQKDLPQETINAIRLEPGTVKEVAGKYNLSTRQVRGIVNKRNIQLHGV